MFAFIKGHVHSIENNEKTVVIDTGNIGYNILTPLPNKFNENDSIFLFCHTVFSETDQRIFGFQKKIELKIFKQLIQVSGVGPKTALEIISTFPEQSFIDVVLKPHEEAIKNITTVKGVGKKSAETLLISVKEKMMLLNSSNNSKTENESKSNNSDIPELVVQALSNLGYKNKEIQQNSEKWFEKEKNNEHNIKNFLKWQTL